MKFTPRQYEFLLDLLGFFIRTAIIVLISVIGFGLIGTQIDALADLFVLRQPSFFCHPRIANAVSVIVGIGTPVFVLETIPVFRIVRAFVLGIVNAVFIVIIIRATVLVFKTVFIFRNIGTLVNVIGNPVAIAIAYPGLRSSGW